MKSLASPIGAPLRRFAAFHLKARKQCDTLQRLSGSTATASLIRFFDELVPAFNRHTESTLYPALIESMAGSDAGCLHEITASLTADHRAVESMWRGLRACVQSIAHGDADELDATALAAIMALVERYRRQLDREDLELLPMAERLIDDGTLARIGKLKPIVQPEIARSAPAPRRRSR